MSDEETALAVAELEAATIPVTVWPQVIKLSHPFDFAGETITELTFRRGKLGDIKGIKLSKEVPLDQIMLVASRLCGKPIKVIELLDFEDAGEVTDIALDFYKACLTAGSKQ